MTTFELAGDKTLKGLLVPYGETGQNAQGEFVFSAGTITPASESFALKFAHPGNKGADIILGHSVSTEETEAGLVVAFEIDDSTAHGKALLADYAKGLKKSLSAEFSAVKREGSRVLSAVLTGAATVVLGGFANAAFFELAEDESRDVDRVRDAINALPAELRDALVSALTETPEGDTPEEPEETPTEPDSPATTEEESTVAEATAPNTLTKSEEKAELDASSVFELITKAKAGDESAEFALSDIKITGSGALPAAGVLQPSWLGQLWQGRTYSRKYMPLIRNGVIRALDEKGFTLDQGTALVAAWNGNKAELPSGTASTAVRSATLQKWGYAADIAREFFDLPGGEEVIDAFVRGVVNSYSQKTDAWTLAQLVAGIGSTVAPATYPSEYPDVFGLLIQGAEAIEDANDSPSFAILNQKAWDEFKYTPFEQLPQFVRFAFNIGGAVSADGLRVVKGDIGIDDTAAVIVGSSSAAHVNERAGESPILLDALDIAHGGIDKAVVGYTQFMVDRPASLVRIGTADA